jgi:hypothetical protein
VKIRSCMSKQCSLGVGLIDLKVVQGSDKASCYVWSWSDSRGCSDARFRDTLSLSLSPLVGQEVELIPMRTQLVQAEKCPGRIRRQRQGAHGQPQRSRPRVLLLSDQRETVEGTWYLTGNSGYSVGQGSEGVPRLDRSRWLTPQGIILSDLCPKHGNC